MSVWCPLYPDVANYAVRTRRARLLQDVPQCFSFRLNQKEKEFTGVYEAGQLQKEQELLLGKGTGKGHSKGKPTAHKDKCGKGPGKGKNPGTCGKKAKAMKATTETMKALKAEAKVKAMKVKAMKVKALKAMMMAMAETMKADAKVMKAMKAEAAKALKAKAMKAKAMKATIETMKALKAEAKVMQATKAAMKAKIEAGC